MASNVTESPCQGWRGVILGFSWHPTVCPERLFEWVHSTASGACPWLWCQVHNHTMCLGVAGTPHKGQVLILPPCRWWRAAWFQVFMWCTCCLGSTFAAFLAVVQSRPLTRFWQFFLLANLLVRCCCASWWSVCSMVAQSSCVLMWASVMNAVSCRCH